MTASFDGTTENQFLPLTESQKGLLVIDGAAAPRHLYNLTIEIHLAEAPDADAVRTALQGAVTTQPAMRMVFAPWPSPYAVLREPVDSDAFPFEVATAPDADGVRDAVAALGRVGFDLAEGPLYQFTYLQYPGGRTLAFVVHHLVFDYFSLQPFLDDFNWLLAERPDPAAITERRHRRERGLAQELAVQQRVAQDPATLSQAKELAEWLPAAPARIHPKPGLPATTPFTGNRLLWELKKAEAGAVTEACQQLDLTPYEFFMAAYVATLGRHTASSDVTVGTPFFTRRTAAALDLAGFYVNTLPLAVRMDFSGEFADFAHSMVKPAIARARSRSHVAFNQLVEVMQPERVANRNPIFSCMLALYDDLRLPPTVSSVRLRGNDTAKFDLWLGITSVDRTWRFELEYDVELIPPAVVEDFAESLRSAVRRATGEHRTTLLDLFTDASAQQSHTGDGVRADHSTYPLATWLAQTATACPDRIAIEDGARSLSYGELHETATRAAHGLHHLGFGRGDVIGLHTLDLASAVTAMQAILCAGAAYLPLDPALPRERIEYQVQKAGCRLVVGDRNISAGARQMSLDELVAAGETGQHDGREVAAQYSDNGGGSDNGTAVYVMFTSGSSGLPKGVHMGEHALRNLTEWQITALRMTADCRFIQYASLGFDVSFQEIVPTLCSGGTLVSRGPVDRRDFSALTRHVTETRATHLYLPVAALRPFTQAALDLDLQMPDLTHLCVSGEQLVIDDTIRGFFQRHPHCVLVNLYGPTETHAVLTHRMTAPTPPWPDHVPVGRPISGVLPYVVDVTGRLAPAGVQGELYLGGVCPAFGYINDPEQTARSFIQDPFAGTGRMYRTGDQVMWDEDDNLIFLGRTDGQVKIRGYRIELGEIEATAVSVDGVRRAVATVREHGDEHELVLFVLAADDVRARVLEALRRSLPSYMVPTHVVAVEMIPTTMNGKVDRAALLAFVKAAEPATGRSAGPVVYRNDLERELAVLWSGLTGVDDIDPDTSLLVYGAHSITMFQGVQLIQKTYGVTISITQLFGEPTVAAIARIIDTDRAGVRQ